GEWLGGPGPYGYRLDSATKTLIPDPDEAVVVQAMFARYTEERLGATALANWLNDTGRRSRGGRLWSNQMVLRVLRNPVYLGKISHGDDLHEGKHGAIVDEAAFARAQALLDERAAESTKVRPTTSAYLLSGLLRCQACQGAYVGAGAHGRNGFYRYYVCRTRQAKGPRACPGKRIPADDLEAAVTGSLLQTYGDFAFVEEALGAAYAQVMDERPRLEAELVSAEAQLRETTSAIDRYLRAFEAGTMPDGLCAPRVVELSERREELTAHRNRLATQLRGTVPDLPGPEVLQALGDEVRRALEDGSPDVIKQVLDELIDRVEISPDRQARPWFWVPGSDAKRPGPSPARANRTPVRMGPHHVRYVRSSRLTLTWPFRSGWGDRPQVKRRASTRWPQAVRG
ncbi:MAG: recombinase family protein, partial [Acidimicrobiales bacterium]